MAEKYPAGPRPGLDFGARAPSAAWEQVPLNAAGNFVWAWFKPPAALNGIVFRIPGENSGAAGTLVWFHGLTMRGLLAAVGLDPAVVSIWCQYGALCEGQNGSSPSFDQPLPQPPVGAHPQIIVLIDVPPVEVPLVPGATNGVAGVTCLTKVFDEMEADWYATQHLEKQLLLARKQLTTALGRLAALDRDLSPEERLHGDRQDKSDWQEVRRAVKDAATKLARYVKEHDVGETSAAGKKLWFSEAYHNLVAPRRPFEGLLALHREFESYRKRLQILLQNMQLCSTNVAQESERKAQQILSRISSRARSAQSKTTGWKPHRWLTHKQRDRM
jgi:hypothetical protein